MLNKTTAHWNLVMKALNLIDKWLYKHVSRNDLPIKDQNFTILCIEVIYSMKPVPNVKMLIIIVISQWPLFVQWWHTHTGLIMCIINEFFCQSRNYFQFITRLKKVRLHAYKCEGFLKISPNLQ